MHTVTFGVSTFLCGRCFIRLFFAFSFDTLHLALTLALGSAYSLNDTRFSRNSVRHDRKRCAHVNQNCNNAFTKRQLAADMLKVAYTFDINTTYTRKFRDNIRLKLTIFLANLSDLTSRRADMRWILNNAHQIRFRGCTWVWNRTCPTNANSLR